MTIPIINIEDVVEIYFESGSARIQFKEGVTLESLLDEKYENRELKVLSPGTRFL